MKYFLELRIEDLPKNNLNNSRHWRVRHTESKKWDSIIHLASLGKRPKEPLKKASLFLIRASSVCPDYDNLVASFKCPIDAMVSCGILEDDSYEHIGVPHVSWVKTKPKQGYIVIRVYEAD